MSAAPPLRRPRSATRDIRYEIPVKAPCARAYSALTSARELTRWWLLGAETDARNAGRFRMVWHKTGASGGAKDEAEGYERRGFFVDLEPGRKVGMMWEPKKGHDGAPALSQFFLLPKGSGCRVTLLHAGFSSAPKFDRLFAEYAAGWEDCLAKLKLYLETGKTCKLQVIDFEAMKILARSRR